MHQIDMQLFENLSHRGGIPHFLYRMLDATQADWRFRKGGSKLRLGSVRPISNERDLVAAFDEAFNKFVADTLDAPVAGWRDRVPGWCDDCDPHRRMTS